MMKILGFCILILGVALQPIGWMYFHWLTLVSFLCILLGVFFLMAGRHDGPKDGAGGPGRLTGREMPGDIHGYSGQMSGGRSTSWESSHGDHGGGSGD